MFNSAMWHLNRIGLSPVATALRFSLWLLLHPFVREFEYSDPEMVSAQYRGWQSLPHIGVVAFRRLDRKLQFRW